MQLKLNRPQGELHKNISPPIDRNVSISGDYTLWSPKPGAWEAPYTSVISCFTFWNKPPAAAYLISSFLQSASFFVELQPYLWPHWPTWDHSNSSLTPGWGRGRSVEGVSLCSILPPAARITLLKWELEKVNVMLKLSIASRIPDCQLALGSSMIGCLAHLKTLPRGHPVFIHFYISLNASCSFACLVTQYGSFPLPAWCCVSLIF